MTQRRYGPTLGAGTVVIEKDAEKQIEKGTLGTTTYIGILEKGPTNQLFRAATKTEFLRKAGSYIDDSLVPDAAFDFYKTGRGAGELYLLRITDGSEVQSELTIKARKKEALIADPAQDCSGANCYLLAADYVNMGSPAVGERMAVFNDDGCTDFYRIKTITPDTPVAGTYEIELDGAALAVYTVASGTQIVLYNTVINPDVMKVKAHNGGRWGGKQQVEFDQAFGVGGLTATTFDTGKTMLLDEFVGATLSFAAMPGKSYTVVSNDIAGVVTVSSDSDMAADYALTGSADEHWKLELFNESKMVEILIKDGLQNPTTEFGMEIYVDEEQVLNYDDLSMDPTSEYYFESLINDDENNDFIEVENLWTGGVYDWVRPANRHGQSIGLTDTVLTIEAAEIAADGGNTGDGYVDAITYGGDCQPDVITVECTDAGAQEWSYTSAALGLVVGAVPVTGTTFAAPNEFGVGFKIIAGATAFALGDKFVLYVNPLKPSALVGGTVYPNVDTQRRQGYKIISNTYDTITAKPSADMLTVAAVGNSYRVEFAEDLGGGYDGVADIQDNDYINALDPTTCAINVLFGKKMGLVKIAMPGVTSTAVQKAGIEYAESRNYQFRIEIPSNITTDDGAESYVNDTIGRNDFAVVSFPSYMYVTHPTISGYKLVPATGAIHGREALFAKNYNGYHKAAAGIDATIPQCIKLPTGDRELDEELLNKHGVGVLKFKTGNCIIWGDRTVSLDPAWKWKHQRELMSYYENDLRESFDWIIFAINDEKEQKIAHSALRSYFEPEYKKRALRGDEFADACQIKVDNEINTDATRAAGDMLSEVSLRLADTVERFIITMSKMGIFESVE